MNKQENSQYFYKTRPYVPKYFT